MLEVELVRQFDGEGIRLTESVHRKSSFLGRHSHKNATITILLDGAYEESYGLHGLTAFQSPTVHVRPPGEPHINRIGTSGAHNLVLELDARRLSSISGYSVLFDEVRHIRQSFVLGIARRLRRELLINDDSTPLAIEGLALEMVATASREAKHRHSRSDPWLRRVRDMLHDRFRESHISLDEMATVAGVHPVHLARSFRAAFASSPGEYVRQLRVDWAADTLRSSTMSLADVATAAGFADQSHFTRVFRAYFGTPPGAWRRAQLSPDPNGDCHELDPS